MNDCVWMWFIVHDRVLLSCTQTPSVQHIGSTQGPRLFSTQNLSVQHLKPVSSTPKPPQFNTVFVWGGFWCWTEGFWGLKRTGPFVWNWCVELRGVWNWGGPSMTLYPNPQGQSSVGDSETLQVFLFLDNVILWEGMSFRPKRGARSTQKSKSYLFTFYISFWRESQPQI